MKLFSVKEVADVLGMTPRGVVQRLNRGQLKGTRKVNQFGTAEWQIYGNREILQAVEAKKGNTHSQQSFAPDADDRYEDTVDAENIEVEETFDQKESEWIDIERKRLEVLAETLVKPLTEQLMLQAAALRERSWN